MKDLELLLRRWQAEKSLVRPPEQAHDVVAAFGAVGYSATTDVIALYGCCGGMDQMDNQCWRLWPLQEVIEENAEAPGIGALFGDYLINSWAYRLRPVSREVSAVFIDHFNGEELVEVAPSLAVFVSRLLRDPLEMLELRTPDRLK